MAQELEDQVVGNIHLDSSSTFMDGDLVEFKSHQLRVPGLKVGKLN
jgi:hypothetical protein